MRRCPTLLAMLIIMAILWTVPAAAQETAVTGAGAGLFPEGASYLGLPLNSLTLGIGAGVAGNWAVGQFQTALTGSPAPGLERNILIEGLASSSAPSPAGTAILTGTCTVDPGDGTPPVSGVPFTAVVGANPDGTGSLSLTLGATSLPAAPINEGYVTIRILGN